LDAADADATITIDNATTNAARISVDARRRKPLVRGCTKKSTIVPRSLDGSRRHK
jgi:hypothetical protein